MTFKNHLTFLLLSLLILAPQAQAVDSSVKALPTINLNKSKSNATISVGLSTDGGKTYVSSISKGSDVAISASIKVHEEHIGKSADIYVVQSLGKSFTMRNQDGVFVPWNLKLKTLEPAGVTPSLDKTVDVDVYSGELNKQGKLQIYIAYALQEGNDFVLNAVPAKFDILAAENLSSQEFFEKNIANIIGSKCVVCHVENGVASGQTSLLYYRDADKTQDNFNIFDDFFGNTDNAIDYILAKASGGEEHTGGNQLPEGSSDFLLMEEFLLLLAGNTSGPAPTGQAQAFFDGVILQDNEKTLRRAAIQLAGRLPTGAEISAVRKGNESTLEKTLRNLMKGTNFHEWIKDGANERLLVRGTIFEGEPLDQCRECWPAYAKKQLELYTEASEDEYPDNLRSIDVNQFHNEIRQSVIEAPLELIARVVENDLPYTEILTADYDMMNSTMNEAVEGTASFLSNATVHDFLPSQMKGYYRNDDSVEVEEIGFDGATTGINVIDPGDLITDYPHAGILNSRVFLYRYPTTATNRNRARSRWTNFHFLGIDIEGSAQRTTDPVALADTNNPTLNNPNCTICHIRMDPVAGAFQNYGLTGLYRDSHGGMDSLDGFYKYPEDWSSRLYQEGDTWYRDMLEPGFGDKKAPNAENSLQWLAQEIVNDPLFASATVKFWWPVVFGEELLPLPEVKTDANYAPRLAAYDAQQKTINELTEDFVASNFNLKTMLVGMLMSDWFRAGAINPDGVDQTMDEAHQIAGLGNERLLTPEQLARKTLNLTGYSWKRFYNFESLTVVPGLINKNYGVYYGGIDSSNITKRTRQLTPLMNNVATRLAITSSCPIVLREFILPDDKRFLFSGIEPFDLPLSEGSEVFDVLSEDIDSFEPLTLTLDLQKGPKLATLSFLNDWCDYDEENDRCLSDRNIQIDKISVTDPTGQKRVYQGNNFKHTNNDCGGPSGTNDYFLWSSCGSLQIKFNAESSGKYTITYDVSAEQAGTELAMVNTSVLADTTALNSTAVGARKIKSKLVELFDIMLSMKVSEDSDEVEDLYAFFIESLTQRNAVEGNWNNMDNQFESCIRDDVKFFEGLGFPGEAYQTIVSDDGSHQNTGENWEETGPWIQGFQQDPLWTKRAWSDVLAYFMTHYNYLHE